MAPFVDNLSGLPGHHKPGMTTSLFRRAADFANTLLTTRETDCVANPNLCQKPEATKENTGIIVGASIGGIVIVTLCVLLYFHRRNLKRGKAEDANDPFKMADWGLDDSAAAAAGKPKPKDSAATPDRQADASSGQNPFASPADKFASAR